MANVLLGTYEDFASEYYDSIHHPTCANFREGSSYVLSGWLKNFPIADSWLCEVGPGKSLIAENLVALSIKLARLILIDSSPSMLAYSKQWANVGAHLLLGNAVTLPLASESIGLLVSSLGDPYNKRRFWKEVNRVLRPGSMVLFTTPSYDWAYAFRDRGNEDAMKWAEFVLSNGRRVRVPSLIYPIDEQLKLVKESGFLVKEIASVPISALKRECLSPKLLIERGSNASVVTGYALVKRDRA
jgi:SAM-dependent methyltransferase